ncbi:hypothetical protein P4C99_15015 [Pontiellaceae bacterium B1224]|nr:hypothetical protein [Pontiellaceae bacterium B1224]
MKEKIQKLTCIALSTSIVVLTGCSAFRPTHQMVNITCMPDDAILTVNGTRYTSPAQVKAKRNRNVSIQCYKEGYMPDQRTIGHHFNETGALDAVGTFFFLVPCIGLFTPGAFTLDETDVAITLYQK